MTGVVGIDDHDLAILAVLQDDSDISVAHVAEQVNLSQNACWRRIKRLEEDGYIRKRVALLDASKLGAGVTVFVTLRALEHTDGWLRALVAAIDPMPEVLELYRLSGDRDYLLKVQVADIPAYDRLYKRLTRAVRLADVSSSFAMEKLKHTTAIPLPGRD